MAGPFDKWTKCRDEADQLRLDYIRTALETCRTFATLAVTEHEIGDHGAAEHCISESEKAYNNVARFLFGVTCDEEKRRIEKAARTS